MASARLGHSSSRDESKPSFPGFSTPARTASAPIAHRTAPSEARNTFVVDECTAASCVELFLFCVVFPPPLALAAFLDAIDETLASAVGLCLAMASSRSLGVARCFPAVSSSSSEHDTASSASARSDDIAENEASETSTFV